MSSAGAPGSPVGRFNPSLLRSKGRLSRFKQWVAGTLSFYVFAVMRRCVPNVRLFGLVVVTRRDDVEAVLAESQAFHVRFGTRITALHPTEMPVFGLGTDGDDHDLALRQVSAAMPFTDLHRVAGILRDCMPSLVLRPVTDVGSLARLAQADLARRYLGLAVDDDQLGDFALCCLALGNYAFGYQRPGSVDWRVACGAAAEVTAIMNRSIQAARHAATPGDTVAARLVAAQLDTRTIEATLTGILSALVPASTMAILHVTQVLLKQPTAMAASRQAALARDDTRLGRCLFEALRFNPIFPGPFRDCATAYSVAEGTPRQVIARPGDLVLPATQSAMFDPRRIAAPRRYDPDRPIEDSMIFGFGLHWCFGFAVGRIQLIETLRPLLLRGFRQDARDRAAVSFFGGFPDQFHVRLN